MKVQLLIFSMLTTLTLYGQTNLEPYRLGIFVKSVDQSARWYENNLDFKIYKRMEFPQYDSLRIYFLKHGEFELELIEKKTSFSIQKLQPDYDADKTPLQGFAKIAFRVDGINQQFKKMKRNGVKVVMSVTNDKEFKEDFFIVEDVDGNVVQVIEPHKK